MKIDRLIPAPAPATREVRVQMFDASDLGSDWSDPREDMLRKADECKSRSGEVAGRLSREALLTIAEGWEEAAAALERCSLCDP